VENVPKVKILTYIAIFAALTLAIVGCSRDDTGSTDQSLFDSTSVPDSDINRATIYTYEGGRVSSRIVADRIVQFDTKDSTMAYHLDVDVFDSLGNVQSHLVGDSGIILDQQTRISAYGNVVLTSSDSTVLETERLYWNARTDSIYTDAFVEIDKDGDILSGYGLQADPDLGSVKILRSVSGQMSDPEKLEQ